jgi:hypothetical protein
MNEPAERKPPELGSRSPASEEAKEQNASGQRGGPREAGPAPVTSSQPAQTSGRRGGPHEEPPLERTGFDEENAPSAQGRKDRPNPQVIAEGQRGIRGGRGQLGGAGERSQGEAQKGDPRGGQTRMG